MAARRSPAALFSTSCASTTRTRRSTTCCGRRSRARAATSWCGCRRSCSRRSRSSSSRGGCAAAAGSGSSRRASFAISGFELFYGREARMYALMELVGVVVAIGTDRWLAPPFARCRRAGRRCVARRRVHPRVDAGARGGSVLGRRAAHATGPRGGGGPRSPRRSSCGPRCGARRSPTRRAARRPGGSRAPRSTRSSQSVAQPLSFSAGLAPLIVLAIAAGCVLRPLRRPTGGSRRSARPASSARSCSRPRSAIVRQLLPAAHAHLRRRGRPARDRRARRRRAEAVAHPGPWRRSSSSPRSRCRRRPRA